MTDKIPDIIYIQLDGDGGDKYIENCATWDRKRAYDSDVKYVRVNRIIEMMEKMKGKENDR